MKPTPRKKPGRRSENRVTLKTIAEQLGLTPGTVSAALNNSPAAHSIPEHTKNRIIEAAHAQLLLARGVEGIITIDTSLKEQLGLPTVAVAGHERVDGLTNIVLDHERAARLALEHLRDLGHEDIAFIKGQITSSDSAVRWSAICEVAAQLGISIRPELTVQLEGDDSTPAIGYPAAKQLLARKQPFTALFAYNDISAIGSIWRS